MRKKENELEGSVLASIKDPIDREACVGNKHVEVALQLGREIEELKLDDSQVDEKITLLKLSHFIFIKFM